MVSQNLTLQAAETWLDNIAHLLRLLTEHTPGESVPVPVSWCMPPETRALDASRNRVAGLDKQRRRRCD
ncbi:hypothetical protein OIU92_01460 [Escherichia coli]|nr:hypothetical protein [Escherichia coli]